MGYQSLLTHPITIIQMGRPKIYHTEDEKKAADRAKSKRYYHKYCLIQFLRSVLTLKSRNKVDIKTARKATYQPRYDTKLSITTTPMNLFLASLF